MEWNDGVLSSMMGKLCKMESKDERWMVIDGPVDTYWIESMNTVLDDNKMLTLLNGDRISLPQEVGILMEVIYHFQLILINKFIILINMILLISLFHY
jgi:dynein heavy chain